MARRISFTLDKNAGTLTFRRGAAAFTIPVQSVSDSEFETTNATERGQREPGRGVVRRTSLAEFLNRPQGKGGPLTTSVTSASG
jgi:hypothetical protein